MTIKKVKLNEDGTVPGAWYDSDYWENGAASGKMSYNGNEYRDNPAACKIWAMDTYDRWGPFKSYLELGCGRGWALWGMMLLPELRIERIQGVDISTYAVGTALEQVRPFIQIGDISQLDQLSAITNRTWDLIFSNDVLEHLTFNQAQSCLRRCRDIGKRVVHLISIGDGVNVPDGVVPEDQDQSHILLKSKSWWTSLIIDTFPNSIGWNVTIVDRGRTIEADIRKVS